MENEGAYRIWNFWKDKIIDDSEFIFYQNSLRLIVLTQLLSFYVYWVFSQIKHIADAVVQKMIEETTELRVFLMCYGNLDVYNAE